MKSEIITVTIYRTGLLVFPPILAEKFNITVPGKVSVTWESNVIKFYFKPVNLEGDILRFGLDKYKKVSISVKRILTQNKIVLTRVTKYNVQLDTDTLECILSLDEKLEKECIETSKETLIENLEEDIEELKSENKEPIKTAKEEIGTFKQITFNHLIPEPIVTVMGNGYFKFNRLARAYISERSRYVDIFFDKENRRIGFRFLNKSENGSNSYKLEKRGYDRKSQDYIEISFQSNRIVNKYFKFKLLEKYKYSLYFNKEYDLCWIQLGKETEKINIEKELLEIRSLLYELRGKTNDIPREAEGSV